MTSKFALTFAIFILVLNASASIPNKPLDPFTVKGSGECRKVCAEIRVKVSSEKKSVAGEYNIWRERLGVKGDTVTYLKGYSAAEELLKFMSNYYVTKSPERQMDPAFLAYFMGKCFPESFVDVDHAKLSGLVDTIWAAKNLKIEKSVNSCK